MPVIPPDTDTRIRKRSVMIAGHATSVSLEEAFWRRLKVIAKRRGVSVNALIASIDGDRTNADTGAPGGNLSSAVRVFVLRNVTEGGFV